MIASLILSVAVVAGASSLPRYLVLHGTAVVYGVPGTATIAIDRSTGRFARRLDAGPASESEGWDGTNAWRGDATGMGRIEGNAGERAEIIAWSRSVVRALRGVPYTTTVSSGRDRDTIAFGRAHTFGGARVPGSIVSDSTQNGRWSIDVRSVDAPRSLPAPAFAPPPDPHDFTLTGVTRVHAAMDQGSPVIDVAVNDKHFHFFLDTGGQNVITEDAARASGLKLVGRGIVRGGAGGTVGIRYAFARTVDVGAARLRRQPFIVLPSKALYGLDGIVGYELFARVAVRLDMAHRTVEFAPSAAAFGPRVRPVPFAYFDRQPQVGGAIDAIAGPVTIDTGSSLATAVDPMAVRDHNLVAALHATVAAEAGDVGKRYPVYLVRAKRLQLGSATVERPLLALMTQIDLTDRPAILANVGDATLRRWILVFDYRNQIVDFRPGGDTSGNVVFDHSGISLGAKGNALLVAFVLRGTPAAAAGVVAGERIAAVNDRVVTASDLTHVRNLLRGISGTRVSLRLGNGSTRIVTLRRYL